MVSDGFGVGWLLSVPASFIEPVNLVGALLLVRVSVGSFQWSFWMVLGLVEGGHGLFGVVQPWGRCCFCWLVLVESGLCWMVLVGGGLCWAVLGAIFLAALVCGGLCCLMSVAGWSRLVSVNFGRFWLVLAGFWLVLVGLGWFWLGLVGFGWFRLVVGLI